MTVYFDGVHLASPDIKELHQFASRIGIKRCWFDPNPKHPHYDVTGKRRALLLNQDVTIVSSKELIRLCY